MNRPRPSVVAAVRCFAVFFLVAGIAALVVGIHDVMLPGGRLGVLFPAVLLVLAGVAFVGAVWQLIPIGLPRRWTDGKQPPCEEPIPLAFFLAILLGFYVFFGALAGTGTQRAIVIGVSLVFVAVGFLGLGLFWNEIEVSIVRVGASIALTVVGLLVGGWEFWYQNQYVPSHLDRAVAVQVSLKKLRQQGPYDVLSVTFGYQDVGGRGIVVLGSDYTLTGSAIVACPRAATPAEEAGVFGGQIPDPQRLRFTSATWEIRPASVLAAGRFVADGKRLGPGVPASRQMIFYVPHDRYQLLRLRAQVFAISTSVPLANQPPVPRDLHDNDLYDLWRLGGSGWFQDLVSGRRGWIVTRYELVQLPGKTTSSPDLRLTAHYPSPTWSGRAPSDAEIENLFDKQLPVESTESFADVELPVAPVGAPTAAQLTKVPKSCIPRHAARKRSG
jgi:hypothetical protein